MIPPQPEWAPVERLFTAVPWDEREWGEMLDAAKEEVLNFSSKIAAAGTRVSMLVRGDEAVPPGIDSVASQHGDIWLRDTGPFFVGHEARAFGFNGWGGKFVMAGDETVPTTLGDAAKRPLTSETNVTFVLEGGAIDHDGTGLAITTEQCLLNPNRNGDVTKAEVEQVLCEHLGIDRVVWLGNGLMNDHTDGHVDNLARFVAPGRVVVPVADAPDDPNGDIYEDAAGKVVAAGLDLLRMPSAGLVTDEGGALVPASYANFVLSNELVVVPQFGVPNDAAAVRALGELFPTRRAVGLSAHAILSGGGAFHCMTKELPR
ncbi:MAG: agmatine deiminase family protein [Pacificimonas sp.]